MAIFELFETAYYDCIPDGIRSVQRYGSALTAYFIPCHLISDAKKITGLVNPGIFYVINNKASLQIYIGKTNNSLDLLDSNNDSIKHGDMLVLFLADSNLFSCDRIDALENLAVSNAYESNSVSLLNKSYFQSTVDKNYVSSVREIYLEMQFILAAQGYKIEPLKPLSSPSYFLRYVKDDINAFGLYNTKNFKLLKGSEIIFDNPVYIDRYNVQRSDLLKNGSISLDHKKYILNIDLEFDSPSGASDFVLGGSTDGWIEWKDNYGNSLQYIIKK